MRAAAAKGAGGSTALTPGASAPQGCWEIFLAEHELPVVIPDTVPEARIQLLCEALGVAYRFRPTLH
ncbi:MAG TPA: hypothetical protein VKA84_22050 [Gemmatimonadaceae bacterium]|nr:hypothetical protein [Gemmatimonadaceae bacterium]